MEQAIRHCTQGIGIWQWASNDAGQEPDVVMACCGDTPTLETLAAVSILRKELPELKIRVVNVVDLMKLQPHTEHPHGLTDSEYDTLFTKDKPIIFAYHGSVSYTHLLGAVLDRLLHGEPLGAGMLAGHDDVHIVPALDAVVEHAQQAVGVRGQIHPHHIRLLVGHMVQEAGVLMRCV